MEPGEQCDCGLPNYCKSKCCDPATCTFLANATCASGECCDTDKCVLLEAGKSIFNIKSFNFNKKFNFPQQLNAVNLAMNVIFQNTVTESPSSVPKTYLNGIQRAVKMDSHTASKASVTPKTNSAEDYGVLAAVRLKIVTPKT